jgi:polysaccharide chain length determinant protein (PEP-CTERM system associated)
MQGTDQNLQELIRDYLAMAWRQKIWIIFPTIAGIIISGVLILKLPKVYRSSTLILVEGQKVPEDYVKSAVTGSIEGRLSTIKQQIMSRSLLEKIIRKFGLYPEEPNRTVGEEVINKMRQNIEVKTIGAKSVDAFSLSFQGEDPVMVMKVTNELASLFIEENLKIREQLVEGTTEFLDNELKNLKETLEWQEAQIGEFKRIHMGELPQQLEANLRSLDRIQSDLVAVQLSKKSAEDRILLLNQSMEMSKKRVEESKRVKEGEGSRNPNPFLSQSEVRSPSQLMLRLMQRKKELADLRAEYKDNYPDVVMLKREVEELEDQVALSEMNGLQEEPASDQNPLQKLGMTLNVEAELSHISEVQKQIKAIEIELTNLRDRERELLKQKRAYEQRVESAPAREQELAVLLRDYENTRKNYGTLLDKKLNAKIAENLEKRQKGEQFRILDAANLPEKPFKPEPIRIGFAGIALGFGVGLGLAFIREKLDSSIKKPEEVERITSVPVLASIPDFDEELMITKKYLSTSVADDEKNNG